MAKIDVKNLIHNIVPVFFIALLLFFVWLFIKPYLPINEKIAEDLSNYKFYDNQNDLEPLSANELNLNELFQKILNTNNAQAIKVGPADNLSEIIKNAKESQTIKLDKGVYSVNIEINNKINITGQGKDTIIQATNKDKSIFDVNGTEFNISNLVIKNSDIGITISKSKVAISNVKFIAFSSTACYAKDSEVYFNNSYIYNSNSALKLANSFGKITNSIIKNNKKSGIQLLSSNFNIQRNIIAYNGSYGVFLDQNSDAEIKNNYIEDNLGYNVRVEKDMKIYK